MIQADSTLSTPAQESLTYTGLLEVIKSYLDITLFTLKDTPVTLFSLLIFVVFLVGFSVLAGMAKRILDRKILKRFIHDPGLRYTLARISQYIVVTLGVFISFQFLGIDLTGLTVILGFLSVGIGFGLQNVTSNFISGLIVLFERPISVGDRVMVNNIEGDVIEINIRSTMIRTVDNISIIVPNSEFVSKDVINYSHGDPTYRLNIDVGVSYGSDLDKVLKALNEVAEESNSVLTDPPHSVQLREFGDSSWNMKLLVWIPDVKEHPKIRNELNQAIVRKFREYGVEIPFPQRDLHIRSDATKG
ncbi:mechanosensitive ion channel family protein [Balneola sp. MJW-20]|uniref:mechanosensitive ion channel family protein n=1 Tax=Gracilimonas aurantiaca TaxID=3234185 RepID=UPI003465768C